MPRDRVIRIALWASAVLNLFGLVVFVPAAAGAPSPFLPLPAPPFYAVPKAAPDLIFALIFLWWARTPAPQPAARAAARV